MTLTFRINNTTTLVGIVCDVGFDNLAVASLGLASRAKVVVLPDVLDAKTLLEGLRLGAGVALSVMVRPIDLDQRYYGSVTVNFKALDAGTDELGVRRAPDRADVQLTVETDPGASSNERPLIWTAIHRHAPQAQRSGLLPRPYRPRGLRGLRVSERTIVRHRPEDHYAVNATIHLDE